jgi:adenylate cyclase class IV
MIGELYAESYLGLIRAKKGQSGFDGIIKKKRIQVKTKDGGNASDTGVYFSIPNKNYKSFDQLLGVRILTKERNAVKNSLQSHIGPIPKNALRKIETKRKNERRYYLSDLLLLGFTEEIVIKKR